MFKISVIICTHNPREDHLRRTLGALKNQSLAKDQWELLLVDNASDKPLAEAWDLSWHPQARHLREDKIGKTYAILLAVGESRGELLLIVDDDNVLRADYLEASVKASTDYSNLGAWSGSCVAEFETEPPAELRPWMNGLVITELTTSLWAKLPYVTNASPAGAGMVVRRKVALFYRERALKDSRRHLLGPQGRRPGGGDDSDMALCSFDLDLGVGRLPELELIHLIPARKLTLDYIAQLNAGIAYTGILLRDIHNNSETYPGQLRSGKLRIALLSVFLFLTGVGRVERSIRLAMEKAQLRAYRDLERLKRQHAAPANQHL